MTTEHLGIILKLLIADDCSVNAADGSGLRLSKQDTEMVVEKGSISSGYI